MRDKPKRRPDISTEMYLPTDETLERLRQISEEGSPSVADVQMMARVLYELSRTVEQVALALPRIARGDYVTVEPDIEDESLEH